MLFAKITQKITQNLYLFHVFYSQITLFCLQNITGKRHYETCVKIL